MLSIDLAIQLRKAGLAWKPQSADQYALEPTEVCPVGKAGAESMIRIESGPLVLGNPCAVRRMSLLRPAGAVWLPALAQMVAELRARGWQPCFSVRLQDTENGHICSLQQEGAADRDFSAASRENAAARALLWLLNEN